MRRLPWLEIVLIIALAVALIVKPKPNEVKAAPTDDEQRPVTKMLLGDAKRMGDGQVRSWVKTIDGEPTAVGITFDEAALVGLPTTGDKPGTCCSNEIVLNLPIDLKPFTHIALNWNPQGHEPAGIYDQPHFDFHFYMMDPTDRLNIPSSGEALAKAPPADHIPAGHMATPGVMKMGTHWIDPTSGEFNGKLFTRTFIYGAYDGKLTFIEPMITKAHIESKPNVVVPIKQPKVYPSGVFPTAYSITFDRTTREHTIALDGLVRREPAERIAKR